MPMPSPVHDVTSPLCHSYRWKDWAGQLAVCSYEPTPEREYFSIRHGAALIDVSPLFKYDIKGRDAGRYLSSLLTKDVQQLAQDRVSYVGWCDEDGYLIDDGTVTRLGEDFYRLTAAEPSLSWFSRWSHGHAVTITDVSDAVAALSVQGPQARFSLCSLLQNDLSLLRYFRAHHTSFMGQPLMVTRTGYTGDLGYELWIDREIAPKLYTQLLAAGRSFGLKPCGLDAMDIARIEAGYIMNGVDYVSAHHCFTQARKSTPLELGLPVQLDREPFMGQRALQREKIAGSRKKCVGIEVDWEDMERAFDKHGLPPELCTRAWRDGRPIYNLETKMIGFATSGTWSPTLKQNISLAHVSPPYSRPGTELKFEVTIEYERVPVKATVCELPFFKTERRTS